MLGGIGRIGRASTPVKGGGALDPLALAVYGEAWYSKAGLAKIANARDAGRIYYVAPGGDDGAAGTEGSPWATLNKVGAVLSALSSGQSAIVFADGAFTGGQQLAPTGSAHGIVRFAPGSTMQGITIDPGDPLLNAIGQQAFGTLDVVGNSLAVSDYASSNAATISPNAIGGDQSGFTRVFDVDVSGCADGVSAHGASIIETYSGSITGSSGGKAAIANVSTALSRHYGTTVSGVLGISLASGAAAHFDNCDVTVPLSAGGLMNFVRSRVGTLTTRSDIAGNPSGLTLNAEDTFLHLDSDASFGGTWTRVYGLVSLAVRGTNGAKRLIINNSVLGGRAVGGDVNGILGARAGVGDDGVGYEIHNSVLFGCNGASAVALGSGMSAGQLAAFAANSDVDYCAFFDNTSNYAAGLAAAVTNAITGVDPGVSKATTAQADWVVTAEALAGAGSGGADIGFRTAA